MLDLFVESGDLELLMRNKALQARYDNWSMEMKLKYGSTGMFIASRPTSFIHQAVICRELFRRDD